MNSQTNTLTYTSTLTLCNNFKLTEKYYNDEAMDLIRNIDTTQIDYNEKDNRYLTSVDQTKFMTLLKKTKKKNN